MCELILSLKVQEISAFSRPNPRFWSAARHPRHMQLGFFTWLSPTRVRTPKTSLISFDLMYVKVRGNRNRTRAFSIPILQRYHNGTFRLSVSHQSSCWPISIGTYELYTPLGIEPATFRSQSFHDELSVFLSIIDLRDNRYLSILMKTLYNWSFQPFT